MITTNPKKEFFERGKIGRITKVYDLFESRSTPVFVRGKTLTDELKKRGIVEEKEIQRIGIIVGAFDPLTVGHVRMIKESRNFCDYLIILLKTDEDVIEEKGFVFMSFLDRQEILQSLLFVNEVIEIDPNLEEIFENLENKWKYKLRCLLRGRNRFNCLNEDLKSYISLGIDIIHGVGGGKVENGLTLVRRATEKFKKNPKLNQWSVERASLPDEPVTSGKGLKEVEHINEEEDEY